jgi:transcriptional regulator with XRE-family HTH domain
MTRLAELFRERRKELGLTRQQVVEKTPYHNVAKGVERLTLLEEEESVPDKTVLEWFADRLGLSWKLVRETQLADQKQVAKQMKNRLPADDCAMCGLAIEEVGGRRLLTTISRVLMVKGIPINYGGRWDEIHAVRLGGSFHQFFLVLVGIPWQEAIVNRARAQAQAGQIPWFCMRCAGQVCKRCGSLTREVPGSTFLDDDGQTTYYALLPIRSPGCSNPKCRGHR